MFITLKRHDCYKFMYILQAPLSVARVYPESMFRKKVQIIIIIKARSHSGLKNHNGRPIYCIIYDFPEFQLLTNIYFLCNYSMKN